MRLLLTLAGAGVAALVGLKLLVLLAEPHLAFLPVRELPITPGALGLPYEEVSIATADGVLLHGWFIPARGPATGPAGAGRPLTLLHFHGNAENIASGTLLGGRTRDAGYSLLLVDYRGYGRSTGSPSEAGISRDGEAALAYLRSRADVDPARIVLWGRSIGAVVAVDLAARDASPAGVILESAFTSARDLLRAGGPPVLYPLSFLASYRFDQTARIARLRSPLLVIHGTDDAIVPIALGRRLHDLAPGPKWFRAIPGGGHNDLLARHGEELWAAVREFLERLESGVTPPEDRPE